MKHKEIAALLERLARKHQVFTALGGGTISHEGASTSYITDDGMRLANPDGPEAATAIRQLMAENERLRDTMKEIGHSMKQAGVPGNDWRREIKLTSSIVSAALGEQP